MVISRVSFPALPPFRAVALFSFCPSPGATNLCFILRFLVLVFVLEASGSSLPPSRSTVTFSATIIRPFVLRTRFNFVFEYLYGTHGYDYEARYVSCVITSLMHLDL
jgi:hypothetical protein